MSSPLMNGMSQTRRMLTISTALYIFSSLKYTYHIVGGNACFTSFFCPHTHTHTFVHMYVYMYVCMYVYMYVCMYICMYVCVCVCAFYPKCK